MKIDFHQARIARMGYRVPEGDYFDASVTYTVKDTASQPSAATMAVEQLPGTRLSGGAPFLRAVSGGESVGVESERLLRCVEDYLRSLVGPKGQVAIADSATNFRATNLIFSVASRCSDV